MLVGVAMWGSERENVHATVDEKPTLVAVVFNVHYEARSLEAWPASVGHPNTYQRGMTAGLPAAEATVLIAAGYATAV